MNYALETMKGGKANETIQREIRILTQLAKVTDLTDPEATKEAVARLEWKPTTKNTTVGVLAAYYKFLKIPFTKPRYKKPEELPFIPTEDEIDTLISLAHAKLATFLQVLKETAARSGEAIQIQWKHIDIERKTVYITAEKGSRSRVLPISNKLISMLTTLERKNGNIWQTNKHTMRVCFENLRKKASKQNPRLKEIHFHTFRHWRATMEYHKTRDIYHVMQLLGHKNIQNTTIYINLESILWNEANDEYICKVAKTADECIKLAETGFQKFDEIDGLHLYRKRK